LLGIDFGRKQTPTAEHYIKQGKDLLGGLIDAYENRIKKFPVKEAR
jgi:hypothetical protein